MGSIWKKFYHIINNIKNDLNWLTWFLVTLELWRRIKSSFFYLYVFTFYICFVYLFWIKLNGFLFIACRELDNDHTNCLNHFNVKLNVMIDFKTAISIMAMSLLLSNIGYCGTLLKCWSHEKLSVPSQGRYCSNVTIAVTTPRNQKRPEIEQGSQTCKSGRQDRSCLRNLLF